MYCPRCGSQNNEATKYCRQCGLSLMQVSTYVATGGTASLVPPSRNSAPIVQQPEGISLKQKMVLTIIFFAMSPAIFGTLGHALGLDFVSHNLSGLSAVMMPLGIVWAVFHYRAKMKRLEIQREHMIQEMADQNRILPQQNYQPLSPVPPQPTNPIIQPVRGSVTEDETIKLPERR